MRPLNGLVSGLVGATTLTLVHELARRVLPDAPRVDLLGMRAIAAALRGGGVAPPPSERLYWWALAGDLASNSLYYSLAAIGTPEHAVWRGGLLGLGAGIATVAVPPIVGLGHRPQARTAQTALLTVHWYLLGGLAAGATAMTLAQRDEQAAQSGYERDAARAPHDRSL
jgi:hypothetical protein